MNKSWRQYLQGTNYTATCLLSRKLYKLDEPDTQDTAGEARTNSSVMYSFGTPAYGQAKAGRPARTYIQQLCEDMGCSPEDLIGRSGERGSGISMLIARHDDDDDDVTSKNVGCQFSITGVLKIDRDE